MGIFLREDPREDRDLDGARRRLIDSGLFSFRCGRVETSIEIETPSGHVETEEGGPYLARMSS